MKKNYDDLGEKFWENYDINNENILRPIAKDVPARLKIEYRDNKNRILKELGLVEKKDSTGKLALLNNEPIKVKISQKDTASLINRLSRIKK